MLQGRQVSQSHRQLNRVSAGQPENKRETTRFVIRFRQKSSAEFHEQTNVNTTHGSCGVGNQLITIPNLVLETTLTIAVALPTSSIDKTNYQILCPAHSATSLVRI